MAISEIPPLTAHIRHTRCWEIYLTHQMVISQIPALTAHISFLLWEFIFGRPGHGRCTLYHPPVKWQFHRFLLWQLIFYSYSECSYYADQVLAVLTPLKCQFHRFLLWQLILGRRYPDRSTPPRQMAISQIPALTAHISFLLWELILWRPGLGRSTPHQMVISQIPALTAHISFLLWELIFGRPDFGRSTPFVWQFHRFLLWQLILGRPGVGRLADLSSHQKWQFERFLIKCIPPLCNNTCHLNS